MLTPNYLKKVPRRIEKLYQELEDFIIEDIARRINKAATITSTAEWQYIRAQELGIADDVIKKKIAKILKKSDKEIERLFKESAIKSINFDNAIYKNAKLTPMHLNSSPELQRLLESAIKQTKGEFENMTNSLGFCTRGVNGKVKNRKLTKFYQEALDLAQFQVSTGVLDKTTATRQAVKKLSESGVRWINYESGWHNRVDVAVRRAIRTGVNQMAASMTDFQMDEMGCEYVEVSAHPGARPSHEEWQGEVYKRYGSDENYENFEDATGYGTVEGLLGANCRHSYAPFIMGASKRTYTKEALKNINPYKTMEYNGKTYTYYEATQRQRQIEARIRATKRELIGYKVTEDKDAFTSASIKLQRQKQEYNNFSKAANISKKDNRTQVQGFDRSISQKSVHASKKRRK